MTAWGLAVNTLFMFIEHTLYVVTFGSIYWIYLSVKHHQTSFWIIFISAIESVFDLDFFYLCTPPCMNPIFSNGNAERSFYFGIPNVARMAHKWNWCCKRTLKKNRQFYNYNNFCKIVYAMNMKPFLFLEPIIKYQIQIQ